MNKVIKIDENGLFVEDVLIEDDQGIPDNCIEVFCPDGFYKPKWDGMEWVEGLTQVEIDEIKADIPMDLKADAIAEIESATTVAGLKVAMLKFVNAST